MKPFIVLIAASLPFASAATAREARDMLREEIVFCSQFVFSDTDPIVVLDFMRDCCAYSRNVGDCRMYEWEVLRKSPGR
jgi:hypothetical protein